MISARPRILMKVTFLKHFALEVWVGIYSYKGKDRLFELLPSEKSVYENNHCRKCFTKKIMEGKVPDIWKKVNITALYKNKGDKSDKTNYRLVSCLTSRLCEKTVWDSIMNHNSQ